MKLQRRKVCEGQLLKMLQKSQTKVIFPVITLALVREFLRTGKYIFTDAEIKRCYIETVISLSSFLSHSLHIGGKYYDAYPVRNLPRYNVLRVMDKKFELTEDFRQCAHHLESWIPNQIKMHIDRKIGTIAKLSDNNFKSSLTKKEKFIKFISENITINPSHFEIFSFSILKVHLEKFACKIYRDTRTSAQDQGVDFSTNFGAVYQIKKLNVRTKKMADEIYSELQSNFDKERISDGKVVIVIDDIAKDIRNYLINMRVQPISTEEIVELSSRIVDAEDRLKVLRIIYDEFRREYGSQVN